jgi:hypothetical protein
MTLQLLEVIVCALSDKKNLSTKKTPFPSQCMVSSLAYNKNNRDINNNNNFFRVEGLSVLLR